VKHTLGVHAGSYREIAGVQKPGAARIKTDQQRGSFSLLLFFLFFVCFSLGESTSGTSLEKLALYTQRRLRLKKEECRTSAAERYHERTRGNSVRESETRATDVRTKTTNNAGDQQGTGDPEAMTGGKSGVVFLTSFFFFFFFVVAQRSNGGGDE